MREAEIMNNMMNTEYLKKLSTRIEQLNMLRAEVISTSYRSIGETLFKEDLYFCTTADRCTHLIDGFISMLKERNLTCAGVLLRMQMDNCIRTYAVFIAKNKEAVIDCVFTGKQINKEISRHDKKLSDGYLKKELSKIDPFFEQAYNYASGYVHLSNKAFYQTVAKCEATCIENHIGKELPDRHNYDLLEVADAFIRFICLHYKMLDEVAQSKHRYDASHIRGKD